MSSLTVGNRTVPVEEAKDRICTYVTSDAYLFSAYDQYRTNENPNVLADGDLLAPALLNVPVRPATYRKLTRWRPELEQHLAALPRRTLTKATDDDIELIANCFEVLPLRGPAVTLAKVLHRKHPELIPLYDGNVHAVYVPARVPKADGARSWSKLMTLLSIEMRSDLKQHAATWQKLCDDANNATPPGTQTLTPLRALDILAWWPNKT